MAKGKGRRGRGRRDATRLQAGATLLEILIVVAIAVPVILAAAMGLLVTMRLSSSTEQTQKAEAQVTAYAESLKHIDYVPCAAASDYNGGTGLWTPPAGSNLTLEVVDVRYWSQTDRDYTGTSCANAADDGGAQLITVRASSPERASALDVVKRNPDASAGGVP